MRLLLDTNILLRAAVWPDRLTLAARAILTEPDSTLWFSAANIWEVTVKRGLGRDDFDVDASVLYPELLAGPYRELAITSLHALSIADLPPLHKDPFDRILVAQSIAERMTLVTSDAKLARYPGQICLV